MMMEEELQQKSFWVPVTPAKSVTERPNTDDTGNSSYVEAPFVKGDQVNNQNCGLNSEKSSSMQSPKKRSNNGYNMNETPQKRMKMKRHRPKVLDESIPKKNVKSNVVKPSTPKHKTPQRAIPRTRQPDKRKSVGKNNFKASVDQSNDVDQETIASGSTGCAETSCKKKLDFDLEKRVIDQSDTGELNSFSHEHNDQRSKVDDQRQDGFQVPNDELASDPGNYFQEITIGKNYSEKSNSLQTHQGIFWPNDCLKSSTSLGQNFPRAYMRTRTKRSTKVLLGKYNTANNNAYRRNQRIVNKHTPVLLVQKMRNVSIIRNHESLSELVEILLPTEKQRTLAIDDPSSFKCVLNLQPLVKIKKKRSQGYDLLNLTSMVRRKRSRRRINFSLLNKVRGREGNTQKCRPKSVPDNVSPHHKIINTGPAKYSLKLIPRNVPPNLEKDYLLSSRDDFAYVEALINFVIRKLACLCLGESCSQPVVRDQKGHGALVPFKDIPKKRKQWPKVHLDAETTRVWNLLMENSNGNENTEEVENDKAKYWEKEREIFRRRMELFITRMHQIQGDRRFSKWKGSVVDSVVGVFLTQNVSDHLSSSAFMSLVAKFPAQSVYTNSSQESTASNVSWPEKSTNVENDLPRFFITEQVTYNQMVKNGGKTSICTLNKMVSGLMEDNVIDEDETTSLKCQMEDEVTIEDETASVKYQMTEKVTVEDETASVKCQTGEKVTVEGETTSMKCQMGEKVTFEDETEPVKCQVEDNIVVEDETDSVKSQMEDTVIVEDETATVKSQMEDTIIVEDETATLKCQESVMVEKCPSSSFNTQVGIEHNNGDNTSSQSSERTPEKKNGKEKDKQENKIDWDELRKTYKMDQTTDTTDSVNWEAVRQAPVQELAKVIEGRGMNNILAGRIKDFLDRIVKDHGSIDLEWLRNVPPDKAKDYLLSIPGLGLKSVECVRLLALHQHAFPVDTNVGRILVRLGWVPLQPLPEDVQIHLLNQYPMLDTVQKYIWPRLSVHDKLTLYEFHYQLITAGKVFCTKKQPNCNACPMRGECKHFASAFASSKLRLEGPQVENATEEAPPAYSQDPQMQITPQLVPGSNFSEMREESRNCEPIIEMPPSPEPGPSETELLERDIEDFGYESEDEIPTINLNLEELTQNVLNIMENSNSSLHGDSAMSKALVALSAAAASIPRPKLKHAERLRTVHNVYELPDFHPLLAGFEKREPDDPCPYLLAIWITDGAATSSPQSGKSTCDIGASCSGPSGYCVQCQSDKLIHGTILIPCRTANRGAFPLNGTYFQVNEVFADHETSRRPIPVPRDSIWNLSRRMLCCGTSVTSIFRGSSTEEIQYCFWKGFVCVRGYDRAKREAKMLSRRFHIRKSIPFDE